MPSDGEVGDATFLSLEQMCVLLPSLAAYLSPGDAYCPLLPLS